MYPYIMQRVSFLQVLPPNPFMNLSYLTRVPHALGHVVAQLVESLRYKPKGRGFDSRWCHWNFSLTKSFWLHYGSGVNSASNRNEYQEYPLWSKGGRCVGLTTLPPSCADCLKVWEPHSPGTLSASPGV